MNAIEKSLEYFKQISLAETSKVQFMNRIDYKFLTHKAKVPAILAELTNDYFVLKIEEEVIQPYQTTYFDTHENQMYLSHQNGRLNRVKIRTRSYGLTKDSFLEVKLHTNKGRCVKTRMQSSASSGSFSDDEKHFLMQNAPYRPIDLEPKIRSYFSRITLVNKNSTDRVTIDLFLAFDNGKSETVLEKLAIIEVKLDRCGRRVKIMDVLKKQQIRHNRISKYCIGRALLENDLKKNNFKPKLRKIENEFT